MQGHSNTTAARLPPINLPLWENCALVLFRVFHTPCNLHLFNLACSISLFIHRCPLPQCMGCQWKSRFTQMQHLPKPKGSVH